MQPKAKRVEPRRDLYELDDGHTRRKERYEGERREFERQQRGQMANNSSQEHATIESERMKRGFFSFFKRKPMPTHVYELKGTSRINFCTCSITNSGLDESKGTIHTGHPIFPTELESRESSEPRNVLARIFRFKPEVKTLALRMHREEVMHWLFHLLRAHSDKGLKDIHRSETAANEFSVTVDKKNCRFSPISAFDSGLIANGYCRLWHQAVQVRCRRFPDPYRRSRYDSLRPPLHPNIGSRQLDAQSHSRNHQGTQD